MTEIKSIEVFQDFFLRGSPDRRAKLRRVLIEYASAPWTHSEASERKLAAGASNDDLIVFHRTTDEELPAAALVLWSRHDGYEVTNIVPQDIGELGYNKYNALLQEFVRLIAAPAAEKVGYSIDVTSARQSIDEWVSPNVAAALKTFSATANKSTGSSHPLDRKRWFDFLIKAYADGTKIGTDRLGRWLIEVEGWDDDHANELVIEYEFALDLLRAYDTRLH